MNTFVIVLIALVICALVVIKKSLVIIPQSETKIIERLGKYYATFRPGMTGITVLGIIRPKISMVSVSNPVRL